MSLLKEKYSPLAATSLELDWVTEKLGGRRGIKDGDRKTHRIALMRHEMTNFLRNLAGYVAAQVSFKHVCYAVKSG